MDDMLSNLLEILAYALLVAMLSMVIMYLVSDFL